MQGWRQRGCSAYKVADAVTTHEAADMGIQANATADPAFIVYSAINAPFRCGLRLDSITTIPVGGGERTIAHRVNDAGEAAPPDAIRQTPERHP